MYAIISAVTYQIDNPPSEASAEGFAALIAVAPGYRGRLGLAVEGGERVHVYVFDSVDEARSGLGGEPMHGFVEEHIRPHYAGPSERIGRGPVRSLDFARVLTGMHAWLSLLPAARERDLAAETGYLGHAAIETDDGAMLVALHDAAVAPDDPDATRTWLGTVTVSHWPS